jgi:hypothetical protein
VRGDGGRLRPGAQDGYTVVEMIITMALTTIVSGAIFSSFLLLDRIQTAWEQRDQARAVGVLAEQPILRDVQAYKVVSAPPGMLQFQSVSTHPSLPSTLFTVTYSIQGSVLNRSVTRDAVPLSTENVAHGVRSLSAICQAHKTLTVTVAIDAISLRSLPQPITVSPVLTLNPRNGC